MQGVLRLGRFFFFFSNFVVAELLQASLQTADPYVYFLAVE